MATPPTPQNNDESTTNSNTLDHKFEGWSIWLEIDAEDHPQLAKECERLYRLFEHRQGVDPFVPHVTLLYNFPSFIDDCGDESETKQQRAEHLLQEAKTRFREQQQNELVLLVSTIIYQEEVSIISTKPQGGVSTKEKEEEKEEGQALKGCLSAARPLLTPADFYFFHYPKSDDKGKGFGCVISMLLIEKEEWLSSIYSLVQDIFPKDERGGSDSKNSFTPHLSLVYAPEDDLESLQMETVQLKEQESATNLMLQPIVARYLSLWSTEGAIRDWYRIARVEL